MKNRRLALWIFGPIGSGKSHVMSQLPLEHFTEVVQDAEVERLLRTAGLPLDTRRHDASQRDEFRRTRQRVIARLWDMVPVWREAGRNLVFETTGNKPTLFRAEVEAGRAAGYHTLACALRVPLSVCRQQNQTRERVLEDAIVEDTWREFERFLADGTYADIFAGSRLEICESTEAAVHAAQRWLAERLGSAA